MPARVNHDQRRIEIVEAVWRIIARGGFAAATMREIAAEAGFANGALKHYFVNKDDVLAAAFQRTFYRINERAAHAIGSTTGVDAIRLLCLEMIPLDEERMLEARVAMAFWDRAAVSAAMMKIHADSYAIWRNWMENELEKSRARDELTADLTDGAIIDEIFALTSGLRVVSVLETAGSQQHEFVSLLDVLVDRLRGAAP